ncbi:MAG: succinylglutamate desuccinylase [Alphaproteobacteria bacterium]|nr:succinylglutamate desuccinylase [Alphaproteobacteria bacterium]
MRVEHDAAASEPGIARGLLAFDNPVLAGYRWPVIEITGAAPGPRLCITGGTHVNELSSLEAAIRLGRAFAPERLAGRVSILPAVNVPALYEHTRDLCPVDGLSIHWQYPGDPKGSFSQALAHAIFHEWADDASALIDLHGGDLHEKFSRYVVWQRSGDAALDASNAALARCFDTDFIVTLPESVMERPGRCCTAAAKRGRLALVVEGGSEAKFDEAHAQHHVDGALNVARALGMIGGDPTPSRREPRAVADYAFLRAPADGFFYPRIEPCDRVGRGQVLFECRDWFGRPTGTVVAPASGYIMWRTSHLTAKRDSWLGAIGIPVA